MDIGFIGLGAMGSAMACRLLEAGHRVRVWNRSPGPAQALERAGATRVGTPDEAFAGDAVITMLANDGAVRAVLLRNGLHGGTLDTAPKDVIHVVSATISVELAKELEAIHQECGIAYVAAPVLGRPDVARQGKLDVLAAGHPEALARVQPVFDAIGQKTWIMGEAPHKANLAKISANLMLASAIETMAEAVMLARRYELDPRALVEALTGSLFSAPVYKTYGEIILEQKFEPALFKTTLGLKDVQLAVAAGAGVGVPLPIAGVLHDNLVDAVAHGYADKDWSSIAAVAARRAGFVG